MRTSTYKQNILDVLRSAHLLSIADIHKRVSRADFSTIFRNVERLCKERAVRKVCIDKDTVLYEIAHSHTHDHFVCDDCGSVEAFEIATQLPLSKKKIIRDIVVHGVCDQCV